MKDILSSLYSDQFYKSEWLEYELWLNYFKKAVAHRINRECIKEPPSKRKFFFRKIPYFTVVIFLRYNYQIELLSYTLRSLYHQGIDDLLVVIVLPPSFKEELYFLYGHNERSRGVVYILSDTQLPLNEPDLKGIVNRLKDIDTKYYFFVEAGDIFSPYALLYFKLILNKKGEVDLLYSDHDILSQHNKRYMHAFKPNLSIEHFLSINYIVGPWGVSKNFLIKLCKRDITSLCFLPYEVFWPMPHIGSNIKSCHFLGPFYSKPQRNIDNIEVIKDIDNKINIHPKEQYHQWRKDKLQAFFKAYKKDIFINGIKNIHLGAFRIDFSQSLNILYSNQSNISSQTENRLWVWEGGLSGLIDAIKGAIAAQEEQHVFLYKGLNSVSSDISIKGSIDRLLHWLSIKGVISSYGQVRLNDAFWQTGLTVSHKGTPFYPYRNFPVSAVGYIGWPHVNKNTLIPYFLAFSLNKEALNHINKYISKTGELTINAFLTALYDLSTSYKRTVYVENAVFYICHNEALKHIKEMEEQIKREIIKIFSTLYAGSNKPADLIDIYNPLLVTDLFDMGLDFKTAEAIEKDRTFNLYCHHTLYIP